MKKRAVLLIIILSALLITLSIFSIYAAGNAKTISFEDVTSFILKGTTGDTFKDTILGHCRIPPVLAAIFMGIGFAGAGLMLQTLFRNLLASPGTVGITHGVFLMVAFVIFINSFSEFFKAFILNICPSYCYLYVVAGWIGGAISMILLIIIASIVRDSDGVIIVSLCLSYFYWGVTSYLIANATELQLQQYVEFTMFASLSSVNNITQDIIIGICTIVFVIGVVFLIKPLNALLFGEKYAKSFGVSIKKVRISILSFSSFIVGSIIPFIGPLTFLGLLAPYMARPLVKTSDHKYLMPVSMLLGADLMLMCHLLSVKYYVPIFYIFNISRPATPLPESAILDILGGLLVVYLVYKGEKKIRLD
jgi:iron complex transport system permease protein